MLKNQQFYSMAVGWKVENDFIIKENRMLAEKNNRF